MSRHETPMTRWYWRQIGGTLIEEFRAVRPSHSCGARLLDGVIVKGGPFEIVRQSEVDIAGQDVVVVQAKANRLGMYLMGQAFFSAQLLHRFAPRSIESVALVARDDEVLRPLLEQYRGIRVVVCPPPAELRLPGRSGKRPTSASGRRLPGGRA